MWPLSGSIPVLRIRSSDERRELGDNVSEEEGRGGSCGKLTSVRIDLYSHFVFLDK